MTRVSRSLNTTVAETREELTTPWTPLRDMQEMASGLFDAVSEFAQTPEQNGFRFSANLGKQHQHQQHVSPRETNEAMARISKFCQGYSALKVAPTCDELQRTCDSCVALQPGAVESAIYEHLSWVSGDLEWQPRLRILYLLERLYWGGGAGKRIALGIHFQASSLLQHLATEVTQTKEMGRQVIDTLAGNVETPPAHFGQLENRRAEDTSDGKRHEKEKQEVRAALAAARKQVIDTLAGNVETPPAPSGQPENCRAEEISDGKGHEKQKLEVQPALAAAPTETPDILNLANYPSTHPWQPPSARPVNLLSTGHCAPATAASAAVAHVDLDPESQCTTRPPSVSSSLPSVRVPGPTAAPTVPHGRGAAPAAPPIGGASREINIGIDLTDNGANFNVGDRFTL